MGLHDGSTPMKFPNDGRRWHSLLFFSASESGGEDVVVVSQRTISRERLWNFRVVRTEREMGWDAVSYSLDDLAAAVVLGSSCAKSLSGEESTVMLRRGRRSIAMEQASRGASGLP